MPIRSSGRRRRASSNTSRAEPTTPPSQVVDDHDAGPAFQAGLAIGHRDAVLDDDARVSGVPHQAVVVGDVHDGRPPVVDRVHAIGRRAARRVVLDVDGRHGPLARRQHFGTVVLVVVEVLIYDGVERARGELADGHLHHVAGPGEAG